MKFFLISCLALLIGGCATFPKKIPFDANKPCAKLIDEDLDPTISIIVEKPQDPKCAAMLFDPDVPEYDRGAYLSFAAPTISIAKKEHTVKFYVMVNSRNREWKFFDSYSFKIGANLESGHFSFKQRQIPDAYIVSESVGFEVTEPQFRYFTHNPMMMRLHGAHGSMDFTIPATAFSEIYKVYLSSKYGASGTSIIKSVSQ